MQTFVWNGATMLLTYACHSALACALALIAGRFLQRPQEREVVWKTALGVPFLSTAVALAAAGLHASPSRIDLADLARRAPLLHLPGRRLMVRVLDDGARREEVRQFVDPVTTAISVAVLVVVIGCVAIALMRFARRRRVLARALANRDAAHGIDVPHLRRGVRFSTSTTLQSPVALAGQEICLPISVMEEFSAEHRETLIAHEVAHLRRSDPHWFAAVELVTACSAFQPLVFVVARAYRRDVELICDEDAVRHTGGRHALIQALALLASPFDARSPLHGAATAYNGSPLVMRARRIASLPLADERPARRAALLAAAALLATLLAAPVVSSMPRVDASAREMMQIALHERRAGRLVTVDSSVINGHVRVKVLIQSSIEHTSSPSRDEDPDVQRPR